MPAAADPGIQIAEPQTPVALDGQGAGLRPAQPDRRRHQNVTSKPISSPSEPFSVATSAYSLIPSRIRSEARRVGKECVSTFRSRWSQNHENKNTSTKQHPRRTNLNNTNINTNNH